MRILALDSSTAVSSVAVSGPGLPSGGIESSRIDARRHAEAIPVLLREVLDAAGLRPADLDLVACGVGPGPFTGLRVAIATAVTFAEARGIPVVGACSLDVIARGVIARGASDGGGPLVVVTRARRAEVNWAAYDASGRRLAGPRVEPALGFEVPPGARVVGDVEGVEPAYLSALTLARLVEERFDAGEGLPEGVAVPEGDADSSGEPGARALLERIEGDRWLLPALPLYLRRPDAVPPAGMLR
ncbi:MAG: tRNA (adenosine(37)-N6)-threonylcarbamoyltransferase complex dimerization subunit type 1 TsaB [bacterium]